MRISDWSSDVCSSDLAVRRVSAQALWRSHLTAPLALPALRSDDVRVKMGTARRASTFLARSRSWISTPGVSFGELMHASCLSQRWHGGLRGRAEYPSASFSIHTQESKLPGCSIAGQLSEVSAVDHKIRKYHLLRTVYPCLT